MSGDTRGAGKLLLHFVLLLGLAGAGVVGWWMPKRACESRASNERNAATNMRALMSAEADFRANDRDRNGVNDFWTGDIAGLYKYGLIERGLAEADVAPLVPLVPQPIPYRGYFFKALQQDDSETLPVVYRQDTDQKSGKVHNLGRFGFVAFPAEPGKSGKAMFLINEYNPALNSYLSIPLPSSFPNETDRKRYWMRFD
jgi:hypothetical protein